MKLVIFSLLLLFISISKAQEDSISLEMMNGQIRAYTIPSVLQVGFQNSVEISNESDTLLVSLINGKVIAYSLPDIRRISFSMLTTDVKHKYLEENLPTHFVLLPNFPNPFNPSTVLRYHIPNSGRVNIIIFDVLGRRVRLLYNGLTSAGQHDLIWNGRDDTGTGVGSGTYYCRVNFNNTFLITKLVLLK